MPYMMNHPQYGEVMVADDGTMYVQDDERGNVPVGNINPNYNPGINNAGLPDNDINALRRAGYMPDIGSLADMSNMSGAGGRRFNNATDYYEYLYGPGVTQETINGEIFFKTPNGADAYLPGTSPLQYNPPPSMGSQLTLGALAAMAGAGLFGGGAGGAAAATEGAGGAALGELGSGAFNMAVPELGLTGASSSLAPTGGVLGSGTAGLAGGSAFYPAADALALGTTGLTGAGVTGPLSFGEIAQPELGSGMMGNTSVSTVPTGGELGSGASAVPGAESVFPAGSGTAATTGATAATTAANAASTGSALSRIMDGTATTADYTSLAGILGSTGLGILGANQQADASRDVADKYLAMGAPYRDRLAASYAPGFSMADQPDFMNALDIGANAAARATSAKVGNPVDNPGAYAEMQKYISGSLALPQLNTYRSQLGSFGQLGTAVAGANDTSAANQTGSMYNALGYGLGNLTQPQDSLSELLKRSGVKLNGMSF